VSRSSLPVRARVVLAKPGMDGHNRGVRVVARALVHAGFEVIYLGIRRTPEEIASVAVQEDADIVGISLLSGAHLSLVTAVRKALDQAGAADVPLICGGIIPEEDFGQLEQAGAKAIFTPGASLQAITETVSRLYADHRAGAESSPIQTKG
jgi:methylmalonyl-CoA mutase C-terminal domain/subunit